MHRAAYCALGLILGWAALPGAAHAHVGHIILTAERYLKLDVTGHEARVVVSLTLGAGEGERVLSAADTGGDGRVDERDAEAYLAQWAQGLREELPISIDGREVPVQWGEGWFEPTGEVRRTPLTVELVARFALNGGEERVRFEDRMVRRGVFERTDVTFQIREDAELIASGVEDDLTDPTPTLSYVGTFRPDEVVPLVAVIRTGPRAVDWRPLAYAALLVMGLMLGFGGLSAWWRRR